MFLFRKHLRNKSVFETKVKIVLVFETFVCFFQKNSRNKIFLG